MCFAELYDESERVYSVLLDAEQGIVKVNVKVNSTTILNVFDEYGKHGEVSSLRFDGERATVWEKSVSNANATASASANATASPPPSPPPPQKQQHPPLPPLPQQQPPTVSKAPPAPPPPDPKCRAIM
ncbi:HYDROXYPROLINE-RICH GLYCOPROTEIN FAMILY PROTEIN [Salix purpurea]|uniref:HYDROXYPROLINE-RICH GLYCOPROTEIN FAMILY PROTEIN n=1 Tax=Salix purpurea TaxID=77065 RepID=A0A9Q0NNK1_SALPP|nr:HYDROXYPROLINE-RICH GLYCOPROTEIN FAMILY PROTEIN [Salix purpurea]